MSTEDAEELVISEDGTISLPAIEVLTGRGVIFGKSGSGKSNSASVVIEELLERGFPLLIVDIEGEYYTLKERYEIVHVGATEKADMPLRETEAEEVVNLCLDRNRPVIIDLSEVMDMDPAEYFVEQVITILFSREKEARKPFLVVVEEIHEFLPQQGGLDDLGETLIRIAKRGRKRGVGLTGMSQRPAAVDKDFITQCDWMVWHRLTWKNDTQVVQSILGSEKASEVQELATGEAIMMTDWDEMIRTVQFRRKWTYDAADTPTLDPENRPDLTNGTDSSPASAPRETDSGSPASTGPGSQGDADSTASTDDAAGTSEGATAPSTDAESAAEATSGTGPPSGDEAPTEEPPRESGMSESGSPADGQGTATEATDRDEPGQAPESAGSPAQTPNPPTPRAPGADRGSEDADAGSGGGTEVEIKGFEPPGGQGSSEPTPAGGGPTGGRETGSQSRRATGRVTDVPKKHADAPFDDGDSRIALWELGHMVAYVVASSLAVVGRTARYAVEYAIGTAEGPFDPFEPADGDGVDGPLSRDQVVLILSVMMVLSILVLAFVYSG
ncbi:MAG: helicase HerA domain-containing protein [Halanaeroarchaeum sp.]